MVQVGERLGGAPGLQVAGHSDGRPHLPTVQGGTRAQTQQRAVPLGLGGQSYGKNSGDRANRRGFLLRHTFFKLSFLVLKIKPTL